MIVGNNETLKIGEYMYIGAEHAPNEFDEIGNIVIGISTRSSKSPVSPYRITLMKLIEINEGEYKPFKYGKDILSLRSSTSESIESVKFKNGDFFFMDQVNGSRNVKQMRSCTNMQYYNNQTHTCLPCPPGQGTTTF